MKGVKLTDFKKYLKNLDMSQLEDEIIQLFKTFPQVKEYYSSKINSDFDIELLNKYKKIIEKEFLPVGNRMSLKYKNCRDAIKDFQKICQNKNLVAELMLFYAEEGIEFTNSYGDINEQFYSNIASAYWNALEYISKNDLEDDFKEKAYKLMDKGQGIGWGFSDYLVDTYYEYFVDEEDD